MLEQTSLVLDAGLIAHDDSNPLVIVWVPDLGRNPKNALCTSSFTDEQEATCQFVLDVYWEMPVKAVIHVVFPVAEWYTLLEAIAQHGEIWLVAGPPPDWRSLLDQLEQGELFQRLKRLCRGILLSIPAETRETLRQHIQVWKGCFPQFLL